MPAQQTVIIGAGIVGLAIAHELLAAAPGTAVCSPGKGAGRRPAPKHRTIAASCTPGSTTGRDRSRPGLAVEGIRLMTRFCVEARDRARDLRQGGGGDDRGRGVDRLDELLRARDAANGLRGLRKLGRRRDARDRAACRAAWPGYSCRRKGIVDYDARVRGRPRASRRAEGEIRTGSRRDRERPGELGSGWTIETRGRRTPAEYLINCAGLFSDRVARTGGRPPRGSGSCPSAANITLGPEGQEAGAQPHLPRARPEVPVPRGALHAH